MEPCPICESLKITPYSSDKLRRYEACEACGLIFVPREQLISPQEERLRYDSHQNAEDDPYYQNYLSETMKGILPFLKRPQVGLDFGCGKTTLLSQLLEKNSHPTDSYDLFYHPDESIWQKTYDFIVLSEVIEHLRSPLAVMERLVSLLRSEGSVFIKTKFHPREKAAFDQWFYKRDHTHVQFFNDSSLNELAKRLKLGNLERTQTEDLYRLKLR